MNNIWMEERKEAQNTTTFFVTLPSFKNDIPLCATVQD